jgi:phage-related baseplate assembly protein
MLIPGQNQLAEPEIVKVQQFEPLLAALKAMVVSYAQRKSPELGEALAVSLANESELLTVVFEALATRLQTKARDDNAKIKQSLAWWANGTNLNARLADMGLERQIIKKGDPNAYPPQPDVAESDDAARLRYYLAPHAPAAGSRMQYRREALTLAGRASVSVETPNAGKVVVTYRFNDDGYAAKVKDATARRTSPGQVTVTVLGQDGDGVPSADLLAAVAKHFDRPDVRPETDEVLVKPAAIKPYKIRARAYINSGPDTSLTKATATAALQTYADERHRLEARIDPSWIDYTLHAAGAVRIEILEPTEAIVAKASEAPYCTGIELEVATQ